MCGTTATHCLANRQAVPVTTCVSVVCVRVCRSDVLPHVAVGEMHDASSQAQASKVAPSMHRLPQPSVHPLAHPCCIVLTPCPTCSAAPRDPPPFHTAATCLYLVPIGPHAMACFVYKLQQN